MEISQWEVPPFSRNCLFTWTKRLKHGVMLCSYHMLIGQNFDPLWPHTWPPSLDILSGRLREVLLQFKRAKRKKGERGLVREAPQLNTRLITNDLWIYIESFNLIKTMHDPCCLLREYCKWLPSDTWLPTKQIMYNVQLKVRKKFMQSLFLRVGALLDEPHK